MFLKVFIDTKPSLVKGYGESLTSLFCYQNRCQQCFSDHCAKKVKRVGIWATVDIFGQIAKALYV